MSSNLVPCFKSLCIAFRIELLFDYIFGIKKETENGLIVKYICFISAKNKMDSYKLFDKILKLLHSSEFYLFCSYARTSDKN